MSTSMAEVMRDRRRQWRAAGMCSICGKPPREGMLTCQACGERAIRALAALRDRRLALGQCRRCQRPREQQDKQQCNACLADGRKRALDNSAALRAAVRQEQAVYEQRTGRHLALAAFIELRPLLRAEGMV